MSQSAERSKLFQAIQELSVNLRVVFAPKRQTPMGRYCRLVRTIKLSDIEAVDKFFKGFYAFFQDHNINGTVLMEAIIPYNKQIYIPIGNLLQSEEKPTITRHLDVIKRLMEDVTISGVSSDIQTKLNLELALSDVKSNEDLVVDDVMDLIVKLITAMKNDSDNSSKDQPEQEAKPADIAGTAAGILQSKDLTQVFDTIKDKMNNGEIDGQKLLAKLTNAIPQLMGKLMMSMGENSSETEIENKMPEMMKTVQGIVSGITGAMGKHH